MIQHNGHDCGIFAILFAFHLQGGPINGEHVPLHLRLPHSQTGCMTSFRLLMLDMILAYMPSSDLQAVPPHLGLSHA